MRTMAGALVFAASAAWSIGARAQLAPPPPMQPPPPGTTWGAPPAQPPQPMWGAPPSQGGVPSQYSATQQQLNAAENAKSFRGFEIAWVNAEVGGGLVSLGKGSFSEGGAMFGLGAGVRFVAWTLGVRARVMPLADFTLIQANGEVGFHLPLGAWDPYASLHGGYVTAPLKNGAASPNGFDLGGSVGADYYLSALLSLGLDGTFDALFLGANGASSTGVAAVGSLHLGLHFDL